MTREEALVIAWHTKRDPESLADLILRIEREAEERTARERDALTSQVATMRAEIVNMLASAHPHPVEHPTMTAAWQRARAALAHTAMGAKS
jgi:maltose-binding protein MalE